MKIDFKILLAANLICAKNDIRYYLNGVYLSNNTIVATDGHRLMKYKYSDKRSSKGIIIPREIIERIAKTLDKYQKNTCEAEVKKYKTGWLISVADISIHFDAVDGRFPDFKKVIPSTYKPKIHGAYNWQYMVDFQKVVRLLGYRDPNLTLLTNGYDSAIVEYGPLPELIFVIMPMRF